MVGAVRFMDMIERYKRRAFLPATIIIVLIFGLSVHCKKDPTSNNELSERIKQLVKDLEYPDKVAEDFARMVMDWKDEQRRPVLVLWKEKLSDAHQDYQQGKISRRKVAKIEESFLEECCKIIKEKFSPGNVFELSDVIQNQQANCLGYTQLMYIIGNAVGLSVRPIDVLDPAKSVGSNATNGHIVCIINLSDGRSMMADMSLLYEAPSRAFPLEDHFVKVGNYWELRYYFNRLLIHRKFQLLDGKGLLVAIFHNRGSAHNSKGEYDRAILEFNKAIEINPQFIMAYNNRGNAYQDKGEFDQAILDYTKAIEIDPKYASAYTNRGNAFGTKGDHDRAIENHTKAIELNPKLSEAYNNRGIAYADKGEYDRAIQDYTKAIEIDPKDAYAYSNRGIAFDAKGEYDRAIENHIKAIEIIPKLSEVYNNRGVTYANKDEFDRAVLDFTKAIEIDPKDADTYINRGMCYCEKKEYGRAILDFIKAIGIHLKKAMTYILK